MKLYKLMFKDEVIDIFENEQEAYEECGIRNLEYASETALLGEFDYHRFYIVESEN